MFSCSVCGMKFEYKKQKKNHQQFCGLTGLDDFSDELNKFDKMNKALYRNDYDSKDSTDSKTKQVNLKNEEVTNYGR